MNHYIEVIKNTLQQCYPKVPFYVGLTEDTTDIEIAWKNDPLTGDIVDCLNDNDFKIQYSRLLGINQMKSVLRETAIEEDLDPDLLVPYPCRVKANVNVIDESDSLIDGFTYRLKSKEGLSESLEANIHNCIRDNIEYCDAEEYDEDVIINRPESINKARHVLRKHFPHDRFSVSDTLIENGKIEVSWVAGPTFFEVDLIMRTERLGCKLSRYCSKRSLQAVELLIMEMKKDMKLPVSYQGSVDADIWVNIGPGTEDGEMLDVGYKPSISIDERKGVVSDNDKKKIIMMITQAVFSMRSR